MKKIKLFVLLTFTSILLCSCSFLNNIINTGTGATPVTTTATPTVTTTEPVVTNPTTTGSTTITSVDENCLKQNFFSFINRKNLFLIIIFLI